MRCRPGACAQLAQAQQRLTAALQVNILQRHGSRYPTEHAHALIAASVSRLQQAGDQLAPRLAFATDYKLSPHVASLTSLGRHE